MGIFDKVFKKPTVQVDDCIWMRNIGNKPASIWVDCNAYNAFGETYTFSVVLALRNLGTSRNGFPTKEVFDELIYPVETNIYKAIKNTKAHLAGRLNNDGKELFFIFTSEPEKIKSKIEQMMKQYKDCDYKIQAEEDQEWKSYFFMLYPPKTERQKFHNLRLVQKFVEGGDDVKQSRNIEHLYFFKTAEQRKNFMTDVRKSPLKPKEVKEYENKEVIFPYALEVYIPATMELEAINTQTDMLLTFAGKYESIFDGWSASVVR